MKKSKAPSRKPLPSCATRLAYKIPQDGAALKICLYTGILGVITFFFRPLLHLYCQWSIGDGSIISFYQLLGPFDLSQLDAENLAENMFPQGVSSPSRIQKVEEEQGTVVERIRELL